MEEVEDNKKHNSSSNNSELLFETKLAQALFVAGECAMKLLMHIDNIEQLLKKRQVDAENKKQMDLNNNNNNNNNAAGSNEGHNNNNSKDARNNNK